MDAPFRTYLTERAAAYEAAKALVRDVLELAVHDADPHKIAVRVALLAKSLECDSYQWTSQAELARMLGISEARASTAINFWRSKAQEILQKSAIPPNRR